jgi:membrane-bound serine protease (ClpP class)
MRDITMEFLLDPNVAYLVLMFAFVMTFVAILTPGTGVIEGTALLSLLAAAYSIYYLPLNYVALVILLIGVVPFFIAVRKSGRALYLVISIAALVIGSSFLFRGQGLLPAVNPILALVVSTLSAVFIWIIARKGIEASLKPPMHDLNTLIGQKGMASTRIYHEGTVQIESEQWSARSEEPIVAGTEVRIIGREGFTLVVEKV